MSLDLFLLGGIAILLGAVLSYIFAIRSMQEARRSVNYLTRQKSRIRGRRGFTVSLILVIAAAVVFITRPIAQLRSPISPSPNPVVNTAVAQTFAVQETPTAGPTSFVLTATPAASATPTITPSPSIPLIIEALFTGNITPKPGLKIGEIQFSTQMENGRPVAVADRFGNPIKQMFAFFTYEQMDKGVQWTALWYREGAMQFYETRPWDVDTGSGMGYSVWRQPVEKWLPGRYEVRIFIGPQWITSGSFLLTGDPPTVTSTATITLTPLPSSTPTNTALATPTQVPSRTPTRAATASRTPTHTAAVSTNTRAASPSLTTAANATSTVTRTPRPTSTRTPTASSTTTQTPTRTPTFTPSPTSTSTPSRTVTVTPSRTATRTATLTRTPTATRAHTPSLTPT
ncbi:MAG: hypothetical protein FJZ87_07100, partial [Chloroflexi bacterium]|nr:hypothetical protein [Chloroflexota bacterium]